MLACLGPNSSGLQAGGLPPLLELMASRNGNLQHNAAFALYGLADNEDNIAAIVREGGVACLQDCELLVQARVSLHSSRAESWAAAQALLLECKGCLLQCPHCMHCRPMSRVHSTLAVLCIPCSYT